ncbi:efflux transporter, outer membrane factor (OMF) lipoprotein, NodT family [Pedobacter insulae]|uniref:Efflux transporter, outer membrane factor (OMF) lipoprotein, NodT family n=2 Tax=Pedobacter insulae TaxID=414048 RepID=A0A1I2VT16_9SPHI|nr:efflux transporter, outer membrane factor (OMF) lipoprotein, NodT family [Pedobacter insulae]
MVQLNNIKMKTYINNTFVILLLLLSSCGISKEILLPTKDIPNNFREIFKIDSNSIGKLPVNEFFSTMAIRNLIDSALIRNIDLQLALKNIDAAELILKRTKLVNLPELNLQVTANSNRPSDNSLNGLSASQFLKTRHIEDFNANLTLSWEADIWGKISRQKDIAYASYLQSAEAKKAIQTHIVASIASGFYRLLMLDAQLNVAERSVELNKNTLKMIKMQFNAGQVTSLAVQQAEAQLLKVSQLLPQLNQEINIQENALSMLTGRFPTAIERSTTLSQLNIPEQLTLGIPATMLSIRPDVKNVELDLTISNANVGIANAKLYPSLVISASGGLNAFKASSWFNIPASLFGVVGGGITQPIFQRGALKTQFKLAQIEREQTVLRFRQTIIAAVVEVSNEQAKLVNLKNEYIIAQQRVKTLQLAVQNSDLLFRSGMANYLEVITAQGNLLQGELDLTSLKTAQLNASVGLYRALGGGWQ